ncbi:class I SAM-dependent methyltransferase [Gloeobacter kilaueensis]|uniref:Cyclopropane fatty acyl phospholipid synthase n=1 Tax=Gloeobacter kilaueensis (strain ATCC BAA-2537 / CCAP 1431/1 / ULC 316 / JS1) TaxID=1183438 RepID=U5QPV0_GLOK1|nr:class I SAM-dependent methyltransferase [Gloeobacter kilaueensis]AGY59720.1 cyclopropane fatty acyl phospholipid synthase [Gloeobacter kilaueensis JS1]
MFYEAINEPLLRRVPPETKRLLDLGCGSGGFGAKFKHTHACEVVGVTFSEPEQQIAAQLLDHVLQSDLNSCDLRALGQFDCIVCSHVLEHLYQPQDLLGQLKENLASGGLLLVALPNVLYWRQRLEFVRGRFRYTEGGLMDRTHYRFFDWRTAQELLQASGYRIVEATSIGHLPLVSRWLPSPMRETVDKTVTRQFPGLLGHQFLFCCAL